MNELTWKVVTDELCTQNGVRRIVPGEPLRAKIGEGLTFSIPSGAIGPNDRLKVFVGFENTCPKDLEVAFNGTPLKYADFGNDSYVYLHDPTLKPHTIGAYWACPKCVTGETQTITITGEPSSFIWYVELKVIAL